MRGRCPLKTLNACDSRACLDRVDFQLGGDIFRRGSNRAEWVGDFRKFSTGMTILSESSESYPAISGNARATLLERASGPTVSKSTVSPCALAFDTRPNVGRRPTTQTTKNDENAPAQADSPVPLRSQHDIKLREFLERFGLVEQFTPYVSWGPGSIRGEEAREWLERPTKRGYL